MAVLTINGKHLHFEGKKMVLQVAIENGTAHSRIYGPLGAGTLQTAVESDVAIRAIDVPRVPRWTSPSYRSGNLDQP